MGSQHRLPLGNLLTPEVRIRKAITDVTLYHINTRDGNRGTIGMRNDLAVHA